MYRLLPRLTLISLLLLPATQANAETENPLLISADDRCAFERVDNESLPLAIDTCLGAAADGDMKAQYELGGWSKTTTPPCNGWNKPQFKASPARSIA